MAPKHPPGPSMTLGNGRELGVKRLVASCLNPACRHTALIDPQFSCRSCKGAGHAYIQSYICHPRQLR
jgi:hypothetical protein